MKKERLESNCSLSFVLASHSRKQASKNPLFRRLVIVALFSLTLSISILAQPRFTDVTEKAGIDHIFSIFQGTFGGGAAVIDFNQDGWEDLFIAGGKAKNQLLENQGDGTFKDVSREVGLDALDHYVTQGAAVADVNKDGWPDLFVTTIAYLTGEGFEKAPNVLLINQQGRFEDNSLGFGLEAKTFTTSASFGDVNKDGYPDLYVCNYFDRYEGTLDAFYGPQQNGNTQPDNDLFYLNNAGKGFIESTEAFGLKRRGLTFQALWSDFDNDHDLDLLVVNDFGYRRMPNLLYRNDYPISKFTEIGGEKAFDYGINSMGIGACDINGDGWMDYKITNIRASPFLINQGPDLPFSEESSSRGTGFSTVRIDGGFRVTPYSWGINFFDVDLDMDSDLYITDGCLNPQLAPNPNLMLENDGGNFTDYGFFSGTNDHSIGRGSVVFDYDHDGDLDLFVVNQEPYSDEDVGVNFHGSRLYRNDNKNGNNWLKVHLQGTLSESNGIGSRVEAYIEGQVHIREIYGGSSHESQNTTIAHFGLAQHDQVDSLKIKWSSGHTQLLSNISANQTLVVEETTNRLPMDGDDGKILLFPNAFSDHITISYQFPEVLNFDLSVIDASGKKIQDLLQSQEGWIGSYTWHVPSGLPSGIYYFALQTKEKLYVERALKK